MDQAAETNDLWAEVQDLLDALGRSLVDAQQSGGSSEVRPAQINALFRDAHTLKGLFGMLGATVLQRAAHALEDALDGMRMGRITTDARTLTSLFACVERFAQIAARAQSGLAWQDEDLSQLLEQLPGAPARSAADPAPSPAEGQASDAADAPEPLAGLSVYEQHRLDDAARLQQSCAVVQVRMPLSELEQQFAAIEEKLATIGEVIARVPTLLGDDSDALSFAFYIIGTQPFAQLAEAVAGLGLVAEPLHSAAPLPAPMAQASVAAVAAVVNQAAGSLSAPVPAATASWQPAASAVTTVEQPSEATVVTQASQDGNLSVVHTVRVDIRRLDRLMHWVGELTLTKLALQELGATLKREHGFSGIAVDLYRESYALERRLSALQAGLMAVRMVPLGQLFERLLRAGYQAAHELGKEVRFSMHGEATEVDKYIAEKLVDPMMHLVRNAVDHAAERAEVRRAQGKPAFATVRLVASTRGSQVVVQVCDDGAGIDAAQVLASAVARGLVSQNAAQTLSQEQIFALLCQPGFSTRQQVSAYSGRGVGLDVAKTELEKLGGALEISSEAGRGSTFSLVTPVTLAIVPAIVLAVGDELYALPLGHVVEILSYDANEMLQLGGRTMLRAGGQMVPVLDLATAFSVQAAPAEGFAHSNRFAVIVGIAQKRMALLVDDLVSQHDLVVKNLGPRLAQVRSFAGAAELANKRLVLVLDTLMLMHENDTASLPASLTGSTL